MLLFCFNDTATTEIYTLSLHDALPICQQSNGSWSGPSGERAVFITAHAVRALAPYRALYPELGEVLTRAQNFLLRSEEHTSELQSRQYLVCRLLLEKK